MDGWMDEPLPERLGFPAFIGVDLYEMCLFERNVSV